MRRSAVLLAALAVTSAVSGTAHAQVAPPPIGPFVFDVRGSFPKFVTDPQLADSRGLSPNELPGRGLGLDLGAHVYLFTWRAITFGLGGQLTLARSHESPPEVSGVTLGRPVTERFTSIVPQLSFNFGTGNGWSYISGGMGPARWLLVPDGEQPTAADEERLTTINYGGGARWFTKPRLAFTLDVRFHAIAPGTAQRGFPGSPRTTMLIMGAGISIR